MSNVYATIDDIAVYGRKLTSQEQQAADSLIETACAKLSTACKKYGKDLDIMIADEPDVELVAKDIIVRATLRAVDSIADSSPATSQASQSAMGYSVSMTYLNAGQQLYFLRNELKELGVMRQRYGAMEVYDV